MKGRASATTLAWWKYTIAGRDRALGKTNGTTVSLLPIKVVGSHSVTIPFVVELRSGRSIRVDHGFDAQELRRLVEVLEASC